jgi:glutathione-regulated potassium-efflux system protein KefB
MALLEEITILLAAAAFAVPLAKWLGFGSVLGYLVAGIVIGPWGIGLVSQVEDILQFSEIGVVFLLFVIGLELQPARLRVLRKWVFGLGTLQVLVTGSVITVLGVLLGTAWRPALVIGFGLSLSSTAFVLQLLAEKKELTRPHGRAAFGILLLQDLAVIPLIALVPLLATAGLPVGEPAPLASILRAVVVLAGVLIGGRYLLRLLLRLIASSQQQEIFTAAALLLVIGSALLMQWLGLSMGLGAFLAGVLVADSEYRHQLETDIEPFKGLLLGLFFIAVGMSSNLTLLASEPGTILAITVGLLAVKALLVFGVGRFFGLANRDALALGLVLAQGGEFAFVLFNLAAAGGLLPAALSEQLILVVALSMAATPLLYLAKEQLFKRYFATEDKRPFDTIEEHEHEVIIAGFGRFGQIIGRVLNMRRIPFTALEVSPAQVDFVRRFGNQIYYGDAARLDLLRSAHVAEAKLFVLAVDDVETSVRIAETVRRHFPNLALYARARNRQHALRLMQLGAKAIMRDTLLSSIALAGDVLQGLGLSEQEARTATDLFRAHDAALLERQFVIRDDMEALIQSSMESARQLRELFESDART